MYTWLVGGTYQYEKICTVRTTADVWTDEWWTVSAGSIRLKRFSGKTKHVTSAYVQFYCRSDGGNGASAAGRGVRGKYIHSFIRTYSTRLKQS
jgi:hypothetical protein